MSEIDDLEVYERPLLGRWGHGRSRTKPVSTRAQNP